MRLHFPLVVGILSVLLERYSDEEEYGKARLSATVSAGAGEWKLV